MKLDLLGDVSNGVWLGVGVASVWAIAGVTHGILYLYLPESLKVWFDLRTLLIVFGLLVFVSFIVYRKVMKMLAGSSFAVEGNSNDNQ